MVMRPIISRNSRISRTDMCFESFFNIDRSTCITVV